MKKIKLGGKLGLGKVALVDNEDFKRLSKYSWHIDSYGYPRSPTRDNKERKMIMKRMHRMIFSSKGKYIIDHIDGNKLNNQRNNLRMVNNQQSSFNRGLEVRNKSGYKGVSWSKQRKKWQAKVEVKNKKIYLGFYTNKLGAVKAYNEGAKKYFGEFARLNNI